jgi:hypothetical protein
MAGAGFGGPAMAQVQIYGMDERLLCKPRDFKPTAPQSRCYPLSAPGTHCGADSQQSGPQGTLQYPVRTPSQALNLLR